MNADDLGEKGQLIGKSARSISCVAVSPGGFEYQGERYRSLTRIARQITGVHWSGPLFFGISKRGRVISGAVDE